MIPIIYDNAFIEKREKIFSGYLAYLELYHSYS